MQTGSSSAHDRDESSLLHGVIWAGAVLLSTRSCRTIGWRLAVSACPEFTLLGIMVLVADMTQGWYLMSTEPGAEQLMCI